MTDNQDQGGNQTEVYQAQRPDRTVTPQQSEPLQLTDRTPFWTNLSSQTLDQHRHMSSCGHPTQTNFSLNQNQVLCLPLVTEGLKIIWTRWEKQTQQLGRAAESALKECFNVSPYPTLPEMSTLALRYSLHPDQVRVWFMVQRLSYGISWSSEEICETRAELCGSQPVDGGVQEKKTTGEKNKSSHRANKADVEDQLSPDSPSQASLRRKPAPLKRRKVAIKNSQLWRSFLQNQRPSNEEYLRLQRETSLKMADIRKWFTTTRFINSCQKRPLRRKLAKKEQGMKVEAASWETTLPVQGNASDRREIIIDEQHPVPNVPEFQMKCKTPRQVKMLRQTFMTNQWPGDGEYTKLATLAALSRHSIITWFACMRYRIKKDKVRWITPGERERILANVLKNPRR